MARRSISPVARWCTPRLGARGVGVRILGRGILDTSAYERDKGGGCIRLTDCSDVKIEGVVLRDPDVWCLSAFGCREIEITNVKLVGLWRYNADRHRHLQQPERRDPRLLCARL